MGTKRCMDSIINIAVIALLIFLMSFCFSAAADTVPVCHSVDEASEVIREAMKGREEMKAVCLVTDVAAEDSEELIGEIFEGALEHTGDPTEGDYLRFQYNSCSASAKPVSTGGNNAILFTYAITYYDTAQQEAELDEKIAEIIDSLDLADKTDYDKLVSIYNYICGNVGYDYEHLEDDEYYLKHTAYGALIDGKAVCQGYSLALYRLLLEAGVDNRVIYGTWTGDERGQEDHTWNIVKAGDSYYNTDITGDAGSTIRAYFMKGAGSFDDDHLRSEEYLTEAFAADYSVSDSDYVVDAFMKHLESLTASLKAMADRIAAAL